ncbi:MAG: pinensin family lanthipeptide [Acidobacteriota bacterium]|nr:pinensin family lanthipeptide [Acidobacteriota bacterium]
MAGKLKLNDIDVASFVTKGTVEAKEIRGGYETIQRACPTAWTCPTGYPVCTHPYFCE